MAQKLALEGGEPIRNTAFPSWPQIDQDCVEAATKVLKSGKINYWTGTIGREFEKQFASYCDCEFGIALANGTVALELALRVAGISAEDEIIVTPRSFIASASAAVTLGATPVFADIDRVSQNITAETISKVLTPKTKAIIVVHLAGWPAEMDKIMRLASKHNLIVIEDCAQAHGAKYQNKPVGSFGHLGAFSFCQDKIMTTGGEGGMLVTNDQNLWRSAWEYKDHGKSWDKVNTTAKSPGFRWLHDGFGTNLRLTEMQSAIGLSWLAKLNKQVEQRRVNAKALEACCSEFSAFRPTPESEEIYHSYYKYYVFVKPENLRANWSRDKIIAAISAEGVPCLSGSCSEIYLEEAFNNNFRPLERLPVAKELAETSLMFLVHPTISKSDLTDYTNAITKVMTEASL
jgi:dTDP-4-amino-4,6-dideoxygalactose transaminase